MPVRFYRYGYEYVRMPNSILGGAKTQMVVDPNIQFGHPIIKGTRLPLESLAGYYKAGDSIERIAKMFDIPEIAVREAIEYIDTKPLEKDSGRPGSASVASSKEEG